MKQRIKEIINNREKLCFLIIAFGIVLRLGLFVVNLFYNSCHCDEAMLILNARSIANNGTDITGEYLPAYFDTWVYGGQSPFATYSSALFIKLLGDTLFAARLPLLIFSIIGLIFFYKTSCEIFGRPTDYTVASTLLCTLSPWHLMDSFLMLDCNYLPHLMIIGTYLLVKGVKAEKKLIYFTAAMLFFGMGFYCYILSAMIIPLVLLTVYLVLIIEKRVRLNHAIYSAAVLTVVAVPYIVFLLTLYNVIEPSRFLGFSNAFPGYNFHQFKAVDIPIPTPVITISEILASAATFILPDIKLFSVPISPVYLYTNFTGGVCALTGTVIIVQKAVKKKNHNEILLAFVISAIVTGFAVSVLTKSSLTDVFYRYNAVHYYLLFAGGYGFKEITRGVKINDKLRIFKFSFKKAAAVFGMISIILNCANYAVNQTTVNNNTIYGMTAIQAFDFIEKYNGGDEILFINVFNRDTVLCRYYFTDKEYIPYDDDYNLRHNFNDSVDEPVSLTKDGSVKYLGVNKKTKLSCNCAVIYAEFIDYLDIDENEFNVTQFGPRIVITRK